MTVNVINIKACSIDVKVIIGAIIEFVGDGWLQLWKEDQTQHLVWTDILQLWWYIDLKFTHIADIFFGNKKSQRIVGAIYAFQM